MTRYLNLCFFLLLAVCSSAYGNMASPYFRRSELAESYTSRDVDITREEIFVKILDHDRAFFRVRYFIESDVDGRQIPLLFDTMIETVEDFTVTVDGLPVEIRSNRVSDGHLDVWEDSLKYDLRFLMPDYDRTYVFFEADLPQGQHIIEVAYHALSEIDKGSMIMEYRFEYNLEPAHYWRSFGGLTLTVDAADWEGECLLCFMGGEPTLIDQTHSVAFDELPADSFLIELSPKLTDLAEFVVYGGGDSAIVIIIIILVSAAYILTVVRYRIKVYPQRRVSRAVAWGMFIFPIILCLLWFFAFDLFDAIIGEHASRRHGYIFFIVILGPLLVIPIASAVGFVADWVTKQVLHERENR